MCVCSKKYKKIILSWCGGDSVERFGGITLSHYFSGHSSVMISVACLSVMMTNDVCVVW